MWSACLRYIFTLPIMAVLVWKEHGMKEILEEIRQNIGKWRLLWSTVGFGLFYAPLSMASIYGASWFVAATWQITIVAGVLLTPLFGHKIPVKNLLMSVVILAGIVMLQINNVYQETGQGVLPALGLILVGIFLSIGKPEDDELLSIENQHDSESVWYDFYAVCPFG